MTTSILGNKSSSSSVAVKADNIIRRMYQHILHDKCEHCKQILSNIEIEAGDQPASDYAGNTTNPTGQLGSECYDG